MAIDATDPRIAQILQLVQASRGSVQPTPTPSTGSIAPAPTPAYQTPPAPTPLMGQINQLAQSEPLPPTPNLPQMAPPQMPSASLQPPQQVTQQPGPIKSFLQGLVSNLGGAAYQGTQGALQRLGIPTDYEKQQNALKIGLQQQQQNSLEGLRQTEADLYSGKTDALQAQLAPTKLPDDPLYGPMAGLTVPLSAAQAITAKIEGLRSAQNISAGKNATTLAGKEIQYGPDSYLRKGVRSIGGRIEMYDKATGQKLVDMGPDTSLQTAFARGEGYAKGRAMYTPFATFDENGSPTTISNLQAIQGGAPKVSFTEGRNLTSDLVGVKQYQDILDQKISPNIAVLNDPTQRAVIAHTLAEGKDASPGAIQALITSGLQQGALSPQGAALTAGILQAREFGSVARKYGGNMNGTEGLMDRIINNQASPLNAQQLNRDLIQNDRAFTDKALGSITKLLANTKNTKTPSGQNPSSPAAPSNGKYPPGFHPLP